MSDYALTWENILMSSREDLNELVARHIFGKTDVAEPSLDYTASVNNAWLVHDWLIENGWSVSIEHSMGGKWVEVDCCKEKDPKRWVTVMGIRLLPELLCRLALLVAYREANKYLNRAKGEIYVRYEGDTVDVSFKHV